MRIKLLEMITSIALAVFPTVLPDPPRANDHKEYYCAVFGRNRGTWHVVVDNTTMIWLISKSASNG
jgi:hypothetical protein